MEGGKPKPQTSFQFGEGRRYYPDKLVWGLGVREGVTTPPNPTSPP